jgi:heme exporter protein A
VLDIENLKCVRGRRTLFRGISFSLSRGDLLRVAGANGSGKTSLLRILCGLLLPDSGKVSWQGEEIRSLREEYSKRLVYLGHAAALKDDLTAAENLSFACVFAALQPGASAIEGALARFGVPEIIFSRNLSQGQRRRAVLARLLLSESVPLWLLDEPFTALDAAAAQMVEGLIAAHNGRGGMVV